MSLFSVGPINNQDVRENDGYMVPVQRAGARSGKADPRNEKKEKPAYYVKNSGCGKLGSNNNASGPLASFRHECGRDIPLNCRGNGSLPNGDAIGEQVRLWIRAGDRDGLDGTREEGTPGQEHGPAQEQGDTLHGSSFQGPGTLNFSDSEVKRN